MRRLRKIYAACLSIVLTLPCVGAASSPSVAVPPGPATVRHISDWVHCDGKTDDWSGVVQAFAAAKNNAFTLQVDCPVFIHVGTDVARPIFVDNGTYVNFTAKGEFILDNALVPSFVITNSSNIVFANWKVNYVGALPLDHHTDGYFNNGDWVAKPTAPAAVFNDGTRTDWLKANRGITFASQVRAWWHGPTNSSALFFIEGDSQNLTFVNMALAVPPNAGGHQFIPMAFSMTPGYKSNVTAIKPTDAAQSDYATMEPIIATPSNLTFANITLDGYYMGFQGTLQNATFSNITALRYGDLQDADGGTVGGIKKWFAPPHLFYLNGRAASPYDPYNDPFDPILTIHNITIAHVRDMGPRIGASRDVPGQPPSGYADSLKISGTNTSVTDYQSNRPDGLADILQCNGMVLRNITATYNSAFVHGLSPAIRFPATGYYQNLTLSNVTLTDTAAVPQSVPITDNKNPHWDLHNENIQFNNVVVNLKQLPQNASGQTITNLQPVIAGENISIPVTLHVWSE